MTTYAYMRVSTDKQDTASQASWFAQYAIEPDNVYADEGKSGKSYKGREQWLELISKLCPGDVLYVYELDRITRDYADQAVFLRDVVRDCNVKVITVNGAVKYDLEAKLKGIIAEEERIKISQRTKAGIQAAREAGKQIGRPTGSKYSEQVKELFNQGLNKSEIARRLNITRVTVNKALA